MLTWERLTSLLDYDPRTGVFAWRGYKSGAKSGSTGTPHDRYLRIRIDNRLYYGHRLAWFYCYREWPAQHLDHQDRNPLNNAISNLRLASHSQNQANRKKGNGGTQKFKGITWLKKNQKFMAQIRYRGIYEYLGSFVTAEEAHAAYVRRAREVFGDFHYDGS